MFSVAPNMTQNAERKHRTRDTNTANFRSSPTPICQLCVLTKPRKVLVQFFSRVAMQLNFKPGKIIQRSSFQITVWYSC